MDYMYAMEELLDVTRGTAVALRVFSTSELVDRDLQHAMALMGSELERAIHDVEQTEDGVDRTADKGTLRGAHIRREGQR